MVLVLGNFLQNNVTNLISHGVSKLIKNWLDDRFILKVERRLKWTGRETKASQGEEQELVKKDSSGEEPS